MPFEDVRLVRTEQNLILKLIQKTGLEPLCFEWTEESKYWEPGHMSGYNTHASKLIHVPSEYFYTFGKVTDRFSPGPMERVSREPVVRYSSDDKWSNRVRVVGSWLQRLKQEVEAPDLWAELRQDRELLSSMATNAVPGEPFTQRDIAYVSAQLAVLQQQLAANHSLSEAQGEALKQGLNDVVAATERLGKKDWLNYSIGALVNVATSALFAPDMASRLLHGFVHAVGGVFNAARGLLPPGLI